MAASGRQFSTPADSGLPNHEDSQGPDQGGNLLNREATASEPILARLPDVICTDYLDFRPLIMNISKESMRFWFPTSEQLLDSTGQNLASEHDVYAPL